MIRGLPAVGVPTDRRMLPIIVAPDCMPDITSFISHAESVELISVFSIQVRTRAQRGEAISPESHSKGHVRLDSGVHALSTLGDAFVLTPEVCSRRGGDPAHQGSPSGCA